MINLTLQTEYSFKECFMHMSEIHKFAVNGVVGVADSHNTFGHVQLEKESIKHGFKPIYGVRLNCLPDNSEQRTCNMQWVFIAKNAKGLKRIYELVQKSFDNFYYIPKLKYSDLTDLENVVVIAPFRHEKADYVGCGQGYPDCNLRIAQPNTVAVVENSFPQIGDRAIYELLSGAHKDGDDDVKYHFSHEVYPQHIMSKAELIAEYTDYFEYAMANTHSIAAMCEHFQLPKAKMVKWQGDHNLYQFFDYTKVENWTEEYEARLEREMAMIKEKDYTDYFLIVADMIKYAKRTMMVGPGRGSSGGSLVCYLLGITEVDPIKHGLIFERFIDINRTDLPDIDVDFPDVKRESVIDYLKAKYGNQNVRCLANINRLKAKSAINDFAKALRIPTYEADKVKDVVIERNDGDARANFCLADTFATTEAGKEFIEKYPNMCLVTRIEGHANHAGKHAAGILVSTDNLATYGSINVRDDIIQMDKKDAEYLGLLKIDCLGLRTLSILEEVAELLGKPFKWFNRIPLDDVDTFRMMTGLRLNGIFQFEGNTLQNIVRRMGINDFNDIVAITSLARPGALNSGGAGRYVKHSTGLEMPTYYSDTHRDIVGDTFGIVVYQEQMMNIVRLIGGLSWEETSHLRKAISKSLGNEYIAKFKEQFVTGAKENGYSDEAIDSLWNDIASSGQYAFNKAHAVAYGLVSYWTAFCKCHYPREFAVACLNNATDSEQTIRLLRDFVQNEHFDYVPVDPDRSGLNWSFDGNTLLGPLTNIKGIGDAKAKQIIKARQGKAALTPSLFKMLSDPKTDVDILFPANHYFGFLYNDPLSAGLDTTPSLITDVEERGEYVILGKLIEKNLRNLNDKENVRKRNGEKVDGNPFYITFKIEDDTGIINCRIDKKLYEKIGKDVSDNGKLNKTWYLLRGVIKSDYRIFDVTEIVDITKYYKLEI